MHIDSPLISMCLKNLVYFCDICTCEVSLQPCALPWLYILHEKKNRGHFQFFLCGLNTYSCWFRIFWQVWSWWSSTAKFRYNWFQDTKLIIVFKNRYLIIFCGIWFLISGPFKIHSPRFLSWNQLFSDYSTMRVGWSWRLSSRFFGSEML